MKKEIQTKETKEKKEMKPETKQLIGQIGAIVVSSLLTGAFMAVGTRGANCLMDKASKKPKN